MATEKKIIQSPMEYKSGNCNPPKGTDVDGARGYDIEPRTKSSSGYPEVLYDHVSNMVDSSKDEI